MAFRRRIAFPEPTHVGFVERKKFQHFPRSAGKYSREGVGKQSVNEWETFWETGGDGSGSCVSLEQSLFVAGGFTSNSVAEMKRFPLIDHYSAIGILQDKETYTLGLSKVP